MCPPSRETLSPHVCSAQAAQLLCPVSYCAVLGHYLAMAPVSNAWPSYPDVFEPLRELLHVAGRPQARNRAEPSLTASVAVQCGCNSFLAVCVMCWLF